MGDDDEMILVTGQGINLATNKERGKEGTPCCKSVLKEILLDDDDGDGTGYQFDLEKSYFQQQVGCNHSDSPFEIVSLCNSIVHQI